MNLTITQDNTRTETINSSIIDKLYEIAFAASSDPNSTVSLTGRLESPKGYAAKVEWLNTNFSPDLTITVPTSGLYIFFEDSNVETVLLNNNISSDGEGISLTDAADCNLSTIFANNTNITSFNEFKYFTRTNKTDLGGALTFINCTNLAEIDLSELEVVLQRQFENTAITTVNAPKLRAYGSAYNGIGCFQSNSHLTTVLSLGHITGIVQSMFNNCKNLATVNLPLGCTTIGENGFRISYNQGGGKLTTINLSNITSIGPYAFCELRSLALDVSTGLSLQLTTIGTNTFENCTSLTGSLNLPSLTSIGQRAFKGSGITGITDLGNITGIPTDSFGYCSSLISVTLPSTCTSVGSGGFRDCTALSTIDLGGVTSVGNLAFFNTTKLLSVTGMQNLTGVSSDAFRGSGISGTLSLPNITSLGEWAFWNTKISSITNLGTTITSIPEVCFSGCSNLTSVTLPNQITAIGEHAFEGSTSLQTINIPSNVTFIGLLAFYNCRALSLDVNFSNVTSIGSSAFGLCRSLYGAINLPSLTTLGNECFDTCDNITSVVDLGSITKIPTKCFLNCKKITSVTLPSTCKTIDPSAFQGCSMLSTINLDNVENIVGYYTFSDTVIINYVLPKIKELPARSLSGCHAGQLIDCGSDLTSIASDALWDSGFQIFIFRGTTPPSFSGSNFEYNMTGRIIYVPDAAVADYQTAWPNMASYITGLSNYNPS